MIAFFVCVALVVCLAMLFSTIRRMYQLHRESALKLKCLECGLSAKDIERVVSAKEGRTPSVAQSDYDFGPPMQKPLPPVVAAY